MPSTLPSWVDPQLRVRSTVDSNGLDDFELGLRYTHRSKEENNAVLRRYDLTGRIETLKQQELFETQLRDAYLLVNEIAYQSTVKQRLTDHQPIIEMNVVLAEATLETNPEDTLQYVSAISAGQKHQQRIQSADYRLTTAQLELDKLTDGKVNIGTFRDFIGADNVLKSLENLGQRYSTRQDILRLENHQRATREAIAEARSSFGIDFVESRWGSIGDGDEITFSVGINLPWQKTAVATTAYDARMRASEYERKINADKASNHIALELKNKRLQVLQSQLGDLRIPAERLESALETVENGSRLFVRLHRELLDLDLQSLEITAEVYREYVEYLHIAGQLGLDPDRDWLAARYQAEG